MKMSVKQESTTVTKTLLAKTLKDPLYAPASQGILGDGVNCTGENNTSVFFIMRLFLINSIYLALEPSSATR